MKKIVKMNVFGKKRITDNLTKWNTILFMISSKSWQMNIYTTLNLIFLDLIDIIKDKEN